MVYMRGVLTMVYMRGVLTRVYMRGVLTMVYIRDRQLANPRLPEQMVTGVCVFPTLKAQKAAINKRSANYHF